MSTRKEHSLTYRIRVLGDASAFDEIYRSHLPALHRFFVRKMPRPEDADDGVSQTFARLWNYLRSAPVESVSGLLFTIARGVVADFYRTRRETLPLDAAETTGKDSDSGSGMRLVEAQSEVTLLRETLDRLPEKDRELIVMWHLDDIPIEEIAQRTGRTIGSTRVAIHHALKKFRELYGM